MIFLPKNHPSVARLRQQGISISDGKLGAGALRLVILNLMPQKQEAEEEYYTMMDGAGLDIAVTLAMNAAINFMPGIAWQAHMGGAITGLILTQIFLMMR